jgi:hypothetical protein
MDPITCPHCQHANLPDAQYCEACGKAVAVAATSPRIVSGNEFASTSVGLVMESEALTAQVKSASGALLAVAIIQVILGTIIVFALKGFPGRGELESTAIPLVAFSVYGIGAVFFGLYFWARKSPYPAAIVGLVVFVTVHLLDIIADPSALARGILMKIIIITILIKAIRAGARHRDLLRQYQLQRA